MNGKVGLSKGRGFTLLELLVTLSIAAILLAVGVPSYVTFIDNNRITAQANDILYSVNLARSEAIKRDTEVRLVSVAGSDWSGGWNLVADTNNDSDFDDAADILMQWEALNGDGLMAQRNKLKHLLGDEAALKILANLDNRFTQLKAAGERYNLNENQMLSAYKIISDAEEKMIEGYFVRKSNPQQGIQMIREAALSRGQRLAEYLGEDISKSLIRAFTSARPDPTTPAGILLTGY